MIAIVFIIIVYLLKHNLFASNVNFDAFAHHFGNLMGKKKEIQLCQSQ